MSNLFYIALATYRLTKLISQEDGPWNIFKVFRDNIDIKEIETKDEYGIVYVNRVSDTFLGKLVLCPYCLSGYLSLFFMFCPRKLTEWFAYWGLVQLLIDFEEK